MRIKEIIEITYNALDSLGHNEMDQEGISSIAKYCYNLTGNLISELNVTCKGCTAIANSAVDEILNDFDVYIATTGDSNFCVNKNIKYIYDEKFNLIKKVNRKPTGVIFNNYYYNSLGMLIKEELLYDNNEKVHIKEFKYNNEGDIIEYFSWHRDLNEVFSSYEIEVELNKDENIKIKTFKKFNKKKILMSITKETLKNLVPASIAKIFFDCNGKFNSVSLTFLDSKGKIIKKIEDENLTLFKYDEYNNIIFEKCESLNIEGRFWTYENKYEYDNQGNWIKKESFDDGRPSWLTKRNIIYY